VQNKILITGCTGFVGLFLTNKLKKKFKLKLLIRKKHSFLQYKGLKNIEVIYYDSLSQKHGWANILKDCKTVIHLAGIAHLNDNNNFKLQQNIFKTNYYGTLNLFKNSIKYKIKKFIYLSSIGVNGEVSNDKFTEKSIVNPINFYAKSKLRAEDKIKNLSKKKSIKYIIVRPPLIYGPNAPGNFNYLLKLIKKFHFFPFASLNNKKSFIGIYNVISFIEICLKSRVVDNKTFLISDNETVSLPELIKKIAKLLNKKILLIKFPFFFLKLFFILIGKKKTFDKISNQLIIDNTYSKKITKWKPISLDKQLKYTFK
jgi:nucleoside-diphosphate-sugar epimerase